jgi:hypothetical protein
MKTVVINLIAQPSAGKSVVAALLFAHLKCLGYNAMFIQEYAKMLVYAEKFQLLNNQFFVSHKQYEMLKSVNHKVEFIITDTCLLSGLYYNRYNKQNESDVADTEKHILECYNEFENFNLFLEPSGFKYEQAGRQQNEQEAKEIGIILKDIMKEFQVPYETIQIKGMDVQPIIDLILSKTKHLLSSSESETKQEEESKTNEEETNAEEEDDEENTVSFPWRLIRSSPKCDRFHRLLQEE